MKRLLAAWCALSLLTAAVWARLNQQAETTAHNHIEGDTISDAEWVALVDNIWGER